MSEPRIVDQILEMARWAPSGDNTQPWRFEVVDDSHVVVHGFDTREQCVYDLDGRPSQMSIGALIETMAIAASAHGLSLQVHRRPDPPETRPTFDLHLAPVDALSKDPLFDVITRRSVQRRPLSTAPVSPAHRAELERSVGDDVAVRWVDGFSGRQAVAMLLFRSAKLRLVTPEAYRVHRDVIEWNARFSVDRVPDQALGVDRAMLGMMRYAMHSWERVRFFNRFLAGTWLPRIRMDFVPALACASHFLLEARRPPTSIDDHVRAGRAVQRFWLTATRLGLMMQPELTALIFARYARERRRFSSVPGTLELAQAVARRLERVTGPTSVSHGVFMGRLGYGAEPQSRSIRKALADLRHAAPTANAGPP